jgi:hypothetical protein
LTTEAAEEPSPTSSSLPTLPTSNPPCDQIETAWVERARLEATTLETVTRFHGAVLVVTIADSRPTAAVDNAQSPVIEASLPAHPEPMPYIVTRYSAIVERIVALPPNDTAPRLGDDVTLDVSGGTLDCFRLEVSDKVTFVPNGRYLVVAGLRSSSELILWGDTEALRIVDGVIQTGSTARLEALRALEGDREEQLPQVSADDAVGVPGS